MARPKKQTVDYFPHYCNHKKTMYILEQRYGNDGYAFWFKVLEILGATEGHFIDLNNNETWEFLQAKTRLDGSLCEEILNLLAKLNAIDAELWEQRIIWSQNFVDGIAPVYKNRRVEIPTRPGFYRQKPRKAEVSTDQKPQSRVEYSRVKKSKVNNNISSSKIKFDESTTQYQLALLLRKLILENLPNARVPKETPQGLNNWADAIDKLIRIDKKDPAEVREVITWCQRDEFWKANIRSGGKLREKYDTLVLQMRRDKGGRAGKNPGFKPSTIDWENEPEGL